MMEVMECQYISYRIWASLVLTSILDDTAYPAWKHFWWHYRSMAKRLLWYPRARKTRTLGNKIPHKD